MKFDKLAEQTKSLSMQAVEHIGSIDECIDKVNDQHLRDELNAGHLNVIGLPGVPSGCFNTLLVYAPADNKKNLNHLHNVMPSVLLHWLSCPNTVVTHIVCPDRVLKQLQSHNSPWRQWIEDYKRATIPNVPARTSPGIVRITPILTKSVMTRVIGSSTNL